MLTRARLDRWMGKHGLRLAPEAVGELMAIGTVPGSDPAVGDSASLVVVFEGLQVLIDYERARHEPGSLSAWRERRRKVLTRMEQLVIKNDRDVCGHPTQG